jgi:hypothetical protein
MSVRITCINKNDRNNPYERITHIGGVNADGSKWKMTQQDAIKAINEGKFTFHVSVNDKDVKVIVARSRFNNDYLKTEADGDEPNNLLSLPECA